MEAGGIMYTPLDPTVEGRNRVTSMHGINSVTGTCTMDNPKASSGMCVWRLIRRPRIRGEVDRRPLWFSRNEPAREIIPNHPAELVI